MKTLPIDRLQAILKAQEEGKDAAPPPLSQQLPSLSKATIDRFYQDNGMLAPLKGLWERPIPPNVYKCPLSEPLTTLVEWDSLPKATQALYQHKRTENGIVEVDRQHLVSLTASNDNNNPLHNQETTTSSTLNRRPPTGNMTNKLTEYTRGVSGQCRPFRPGGMAEEPASSSSLVEQNPYLTEQAIVDSLKPLQQGTKASWEDGTLITAPPGVSFQVGISYDDIYRERPKDATTTTTYVAPPTPPTTTNVNEPQTSIPEASNTNSTRLTPAIQWEQQFMEDDSLFGSESESEDDSEEQSLEEGKEKDENEHEHAERDLNVEIENIPTGPTPVQPSDLDPITGSEEDIDKLLKEFTRAEARTKKQFDVKDDEDNLHLNPLELAELQAKMQTDTTRKSWASTTLLPIDDFHSFIPNPAMTFPFTLDTFQQQAIARLERNESVFVAAHTSAGKTVVAEYACALAKQRGTRCVYTSPIKALSNQKFRDFSQKFGSEDVGLITGDLQLNTDDSSCLIMTTEILRSMLYRGADLIRDIEWVIFDEVHYVNDSERGVVWEEVIIMLPSYVNLIFLSATTPNTLDFSDWIGRTKRKPVHVIKTDYRPVPLSHYLWANLKLHKVMEGKSGFYDKGHQEASNALKPKSDVKGAKGQKPPSSARGPANMAWQAQGSKADWMSLVRFLEREELTPTIIFSFSKKKCEEIANQLRSLDLNTANEAGIVQGFTIQTIARLSPNDAVLPQVLTVCEMVKRGIGVHHGGLLPILKEMVEILFSRNLIKVLFATETFAIGVNMPARSVVFNSIRKHDGTQFRVLEPGEYTQMAGRAGRRGLDKVGTVIMCCFGETPPPIGMLRNMLTGQSTMLRSQFRLTYNMILNLLRVEEMSVENMIKKSFSEFATQRALTSNEYPKLLARGRKTLTKLEEQVKTESSQWVGAEDLEEYFLTCNQLIKKNTELLKSVVASPDDSAEAVLSTGRVLLVSAARKFGVVRTPAMILENQALSGSSAPSEATGNPSIQLICMVLLPEGYISDQDSNQHGEPKAVAIGSKGYASNRHFGIFEISADQILLVTAAKNKIEPGNIFKDAKTTSKRGGHGAAASSFFGAKPISRGFEDPFAGMKARGGKKDGDGAFFGSKKKSAMSSEAEAIEKAMSTLVEMEKEESTTGVKALDLRDTVKRGNDVVDFIRECGSVEILVESMRSFVSHRHPTLEKYYTLVERKQMLSERVDALNHLLSNESLQLFPDFLQRKAVLRTLGYLDDNETVSVKGRVACEVNSCEELIATEMVFEGILNELEPTEIVAALSALIYQQRGDENLDMEVPDTLVDCCGRMKTIALNLGQLQKEHGLNVDPEEYAASTLQFGLVHVVYEWAMGVPFSNICELTETQEGSIVRCITRLDETCREIRNCARVVGNPTLYRKMEAASVAIKRDIVFAASLYVS